MRSLAERQAIPAGWPAAAARGSTPAVLPPCHAAQRLPLPLDRRLASNPTPVPQEAL